MNPQYILERWEHGWLFCCNRAARGIPLHAIPECQRLFPKGAVMDSGIAHHYFASGRSEVVTCVTTANAGRQWRAAIAEILSTLPKEDRWWRGTDVGLSSAAIFAVFCNPSLRETVHSYSHGSTPADADDFDRCKRMLALFPAWRERLSEVAQAYEGTIWPKIVSLWTELESADPERCSRLLQAVRQ